MFAGRIHDMLLPLFFTMSFSSPYPNYARENQGETMRCMLPVGAVPPQYYYANNITDLRGSTGMSLVCLSKPMIFPFYLYSLKLF